MIDDRKTEAYMMQLVITHTTDPEGLMEEFKLQLGQSFVYNKEPDREAIKGLQEIISPNMNK